MGHRSDIEDYLERVLPETSKALIAEIDAALELDSRIVLGLAKISVIDMISAQDQGDSDGVRDAVSVSRFFLELYDRLSEAEELAAFKEQQALRRRQEAPVKMEPGDLNMPGETWLVDDNSERPE